MNRNLRVKTLFFALLLLLAGKGATAQTYVQHYADEHKNLALDLAKEFGIPRPIILAVAVIESSCGSAANCRDLKNHFGIVGSNNVSRHTRYKQYGTVSESFRDFCDLLTHKDFYNRLKGSTDLSAWTEAISKAGYSSQPKVWKQKVMSIIKTNNL